MHISTVLLRWHKSFNVNYNGYADRKKDVLSRPWNSLHLDDESSKEDFLFIEIPIEGDITTIVGANESGKSHLLDAICKVLNGYGNDDRFLDRPNEDKKFAVTDLCHFSSVRTKNAEAFPNIGLSFDEVSEPEATRILTFLRESSANAIEGIPTLTTLIVNHGFTFIVAPREGLTEYAYVYIGDVHISLTEEQVEPLRELLPKVEFIRSNLPIADEISLEDLIRAYAGVQNFSSYEPTQLLALAKHIAELPTEALKTQSGAEVVAEIHELKRQVAASQIESPSQGRLEAMLFDKIMGITLEALEKVANLKLTNRSFAEGQIALWNSVLRDELNLSRYWQQDPYFRLQLNLKRGIIYFEIEDKTGSKYTFAERSSGLRYFLSYYIQAKALEIAKSDRPIVILMDEPDSFLSTEGQRNLLAVFESLVDPSSSKGKAQLIYTTHSPWLINRNFPGRIRLVRKGEAEEGTQYIHSPVMRRYEPVRSALGVDCAQTLMMGATNLMLEGPTEQLLLCELIRCFALPTTLYQFLNLNSTITISAESAANIPKILARSQAGDEVQPATVVLVDNDDEGRLAIEKCCKDLFLEDESGDKFKFKNALPRRFALTVADLLGESFGKGKSKQKIVSIEDLVPVALYAEAVRRYLVKWQGEKYEASKEALESTLQDDALAKEGLVEGVKQLLISTQIHPKGKFDKIGVAEEVLGLVIESQAKHSDEEHGPSVNELRERLLRCCRVLQERIDEAERSQKTQTGTGTIRLSLRQFMAGRRSATVADLIRILRRLTSEIELLGEDGAKLREVTNGALEKLSALEQMGQPRIENELWRQWSDFINGIQKNPLSPQVPVPQQTQLQPNDSLTPVTASPDTEVAIVPA